MKKNKLAIQIAQEIRSDDVGLWQVAKSAIKFEGKADQKSFIIDCISEILDLGGRPVRWSNALQKWVEVKDFGSNFEEISQNIYDYMDRRGMAVDMDDIWFTS